MSILLVGVDGEVGEAVIARLIEQGDEVRVVEPDEAAATRWRALGAHVARGGPDDADLFERAAQNVRTVVVLAELDLDPVIRGALAARVERMVLCAGGHDRPPVSSTDIELVALVVPRTRFARRSLLTPVQLAEAVDAADDMAEPPRGLVDLGEESGWRTLGLPPPPG